jgi:ATP-binding cassette subfamily B protein
MAMLAFTRYCWRVFFGEYHTDAAEDLRNRIFSHLVGMGPRFFKKNPVGELMSVVINDVQSFRNAIGSGVLVFFDGIIIISVTLPLMLWLEPQWTWKTMILLPLVPLLIRKLTDLIYHAYKKQQDRLAELSGVSQELVAGIRVIKSFAQEKNRLRHYDESSRSYELACNRTALWESLFGPVMEFGVASGSVILLFVAANDVMSGVATLGTLIAFQRYIQKMTWPMTALGLGFSQYQKGMASFARVVDILDQATDIPDHGQVRQSEFQSLEVRDLSYQYDDGTQPVLQNLSFQIQAGQTVGLVGPVGSGKSTLLHLLTRLHPVPAGHIFVNQHSIESIAQEDLRNLVTMVPQEPFLFSESIAANMSFGLPEIAEIQALKKVAHAVQIEDEVLALPEQFNSPLGERGVNLSGGQKQRLTIARSLVMPASLIILDDSLSAVDTRTEAEIKSQLRIAGVQRTLLIVAHRLSSIENADQIIVLNQGRIEAIGRHAELLISSPTYAAMARTQSSGEAHA